MRWTAHSHLEVSMPKKMLWALVAPCITFGPLFMTRIAGTARTDAPYLVEAGVGMLVVGLVVMFRVLVHQSREIEELKRSLSGSSGK